MITDMEAIPPMMPKVTPSFVVSVLKKVWLESNPNLAKGHLEVRAVAEAVRNADVTKTASRW